METFVYGNGVESNECNTKNQPNDTIFEEINKISFLFLLYSPFFLFCRRNFI